MRAPRGRRRTSGEGGRAQSANDAAPSLVRWRSMKARPRFCGGRGRGGQIGREQGNSRPARSRETNGAAASGTVGGVSRGGVRSWVAVVPRATAPASDELAGWKERAPPDNRPLQSDEGRALRRSMGGVCRGTASCARGPAAVVRSKALPVRAFAAERQHVGQRKPDGMRGEINARVAGACRWKTGGTAVLGRGGGRGEARRRRGGRIERRLGSSRGAAVQWKAVVALGTGGQRNANLDSGKEAPVERGTSRRSADGFQDADSVALALIVRGPGRQSANEQDSAIEEDTGRRRAETWTRALMRS